MSLVAHRHRRDPVVRVVGFVWLVLSTVGFSIPFDHTVRPAAIGPW